MKNEAYPHGVQQFVFTSQDLPPEFKCQILSFLRITFPEGFVGENRLRDWITKDYEHTIHIVLVEQGIMIRHTEVKWKYLEHAGEIYKVFSLSGVLTYPAFREQGYGRRIVEAGTAYIASADADIGMFHCAPHLKNFYTNQWC